MPKNKNLFLGYITSGLLFLFIPTVSIFDVMPDFIGYLLIIRGVFCLYDLNEDIYSARSGFLKLFYIDLAKTLLLPFLLSLKDETTVMTVTFIFSVIEGILLYNALSSLFTGLNYVAERLGAKYADRGIRDVFIVSGVFTVARYVLLCLPELTVLTSLDYQMTDDLSAFTVYDYKTLITIACAVISFIIGLHFLSSCVRYINGLKHDEEFKKSLSERYKKEVLENEALLIRRNTRTGCTFAVSSVIMMCPFLLEGVDVTFSFIPLILAYLGISKLYSLEKSVKKSRSFTFICIFASLPFCAFSTYVCAEYHHYSYQIEEKAVFMYKLCAVCQSFEVILCLSSLFAFLFSLEKILKKYGVDKNVSVGGFQHKEQLKTSAFLSKLLKFSYAVSCIVCVLVCVNFFLYINNEFMWIVSLILLILHSVFVSKCIFKISLTVEENNM